MGSKETRNPVNIITNYSFMHVRHEALFFVALTKYNANASVVFETVHRIIEIFKAYFGGNIDEESLRSHVVLAHELLDGTCCITSYTMFRNVRLGLSTNSQSRSDQALHFPERVNQTGKTQARQNS